MNRRDDDPGRTQRGGRTLRFESSSTLTVPSPKPSTRVYLTSRIVTLKPSASVSTEYAGNRIHVRRPRT